MKCAFTSNKFYIKPLAESSAIQRRASQSNCVWLALSVNKLGFLINCFPLQLKRKIEERKIFLWSIADHVCDPARFHCAYTHTPKSVGALLHSIQLEEPNFYDEFSTRELPANMLPCKWTWIHEKKKKKSLVDSIFKSSCRLDKEHWL